MILFKLIIKFWLKKNKKLRIKIFEILKYLYHKISQYKFINLNFYCNKLKKSKIKKYKKYAILMKNIEH